MPPNKKPYKKNDKKRKLKKDSQLVYYKSNKSFTGRGPNNVMSVKMLYAETYGLNPGALGVASIQQFRIGSIFDPDETGAGHQPMSYDQISQLYERYQVWKVDFEIEFCYGVSSTADGVAGIGYRFSDRPQTSADPRELIENGGGEFGLLTGGNAHKRYNGTVKLSDIHGVSYTQYMSEEDYGADFGSNPVENAYLQIYADGTTDDLGAVKARVRLTFHVKVMGSILQTLN